MNKNFVLLPFASVFLLSAVIGAQLIVAVTAQRTVGVSEGDWGEYAFTWSGNGTMPAPGDKGEWVKITVQEISGTNIIFEQINRFADNTERTATLVVDVDTGQGEGTGCFTAENLNAGDLIYTSPPPPSGPIGVPFQDATINETIFWTYPVGTVEVNHLNLTSPGASINYYWFRATGMMAEWSMYFSSQEAGSTTWVKIECEVVARGRTKEGDSTRLIDYLTRPDVLGTVLAVISLLGGGAAWFMGRRRRVRLRTLLDEVDGVYSRFKMNSRRCEAELHRLKDVALEKLKKGKINESSYDVIKDRIDEYLNEVRERIVDERLGGFPSKLRDALHGMIKRGEISEKEYKTLGRLIERTAELKERDKAQLRKLLEKWKKDYLKKQ